MPDDTQRFSFSPPTSFRFLLAASLTLTLLATGCSGPGESGSGNPSETVDVPPALEIPTENDEVAAPRAVEDVAGLMPSNFPEDLPLHRPSSLVNFGDDEQRAWVELLSDDPPIHVEQTLTNRLRSGGWSMSPIDSGSEHRTFELRRSGHVARLTIRKSGPGTLFRYEY